MKPLGGLVPGLRSETSGVYGAGTLMAVFTMVTDAFSPSARPFSVVTVATPADRIVDAVTAGPRGTGWAARFRPAL